MWLSECILCELHSSCLLAEGYYSLIIIIALPVHWCATSVGLIFKLPLLTILFFSISCLIPTFPWTKHHDVTCSFVLTVTVSYLCICHIQIQDIFYEAGIIQMQHCFWIILMTVYNPNMFSFFFKRLANSLVSLLLRPQLICFPSTLLNHSVEPLWLPCSFRIRHHMFHFLHESFLSSVTQPLSKFPSPAS